MYNVKVVKEKELIKPWVWLKPRVTLTKEEQKEEKEKWVLR